MTLLNPEQYTGYAKHPTQDKTLRKVVNSSIRKCEHMSQWYEIRIEFEGGKIFYSSSGSIKGCKQIFAFQCKAGSKWSINELNKE
ncbi:hypothetical protein [uncultured Dysgonomonas sp.]|nr:hypothetical protein [uncultured Dysgonomonas sp.]